MARVLSLKGKRPVWGGIGDTSSIAPAEGTFQTMEGAVVSRDGTEIVPAPAGVECGLPFYGQAFTLISVTPGVSTTTVVVNAAADDDGNAFLPGAFFVGFRGNTDIDDGVYLATRTDVDEFTIPTVASGTATNGYCFVQRKHVVHDMRTVDGRAAIVLETSVYSGVTTEHRNLATMVCSGQLSMESPPEFGVPDEDDEGFVMWPSPTMFPLNTSEIGHDSSLIAVMRNYDIVRRMQCDGYNGRLVISVPGVWSCFEANIRIANEWMPRDATLVSNQANPRWTRMLGIPRGILPNAGAVATGAGALTTAKFYAYAVAYYNPYTDELGLMSPIQVVELTGGATAFKAYTVTPRGAAYEAVGLQALLYLAGPFDDSATAATANMQPYYASGPYKTADDKGANSNSTTHYVVEWTVSQNFNLLRPIRPRRPGIIESALPGGSWIRACRGRVFTGGELPRTWDIHAWPVAQTSIIDSKTDYYLTTPGEWNTNAVEPGPLAWMKFPSSMGGKRVAQIGSASVANLGIVRSLHNAVVGSISGGNVSGAVGPTAVKVDFIAGTVGGYTSSAPDTRLEYRIFARPLDVNFTEPGAPAAASAINDLPIDTNSDTLTIAGTRIGDQLLIHTQRQTAVFSWASLPVFSSSTIISNTDGCVATHSSIEVPGGAIAFSDRGPVMWPSGEWIGSGLKGVWDSFARDSTGLVICCGSAYDKDRNIAMWGVRRDQTASAWTDLDNDADRHKVACDTILCFHLGTRAWSLIDRSGEKLIESLATMLVDGRMLPVVASGGQSLTVDQQWPLYCLDGVTERGASTDYTITEIRDPSTYVATTGDHVYDCPLGDDALIRSADGSECKWFGPSGGDAGTGMYCGATSSDADGATWDVGDVISTRCAIQTLETHRIASYGDGSVTRVESITIVADVPEGAYAYCRVTAITENADDAEIVLSEPWGTRMKNGPTQILGKAASHDAILRIEVVSTSEIRIKDILIEAG